MDYSFTSHETEKALLQRITKQREDSHTETTINVAWASDASSTSGRMTKLFEKRGHRHSPVPERPHYGKRKIRVKREEFQRGLSSENPNPMASIRQDSAALLSPIHVAQRTPMGHTTHCAYFDAKTGMLLVPEEPDPPPSANSGSSVRTGHTHTTRASSLSASRPSTAPVSLASVAPSHTGGYAPTGSLRAPSGLHLQMRGFNAPLAPPTIHRGVTFSASQRDALAVLRRAQSSGTPDPWKPKKVLGRAAHSFPHGGVAASGPKATFSMNARFTPCHSHTYS